MRVIGQITRPVASILHPGDGSDEQIPCIRLTLHTPEDSSIGYIGLQADQTWRSFPPLIIYSFSFDRDPCYWCPLQLKYLALSLRRRKDAIFCGILVGLLPIWTILDTNDQVLQLFQVLHTNLPQTATVHDFFTDPQDVIYPR
jgi:hypothetical protein